MNENEKGPKLPVIALVALLLAALILPGIVLRQQAGGGLDPVYIALCVFLAVNLLICYWEIALFRRRDYIETRTEYWRERQRETGRVPAVEYFFGKTSLWRMFSMTLWADVWATYAQYDGAFADRKSFGFNADISNGHITLIPTVLLYGAFATGFLPPLAAGLLGVALFWQQAYVTSVYLNAFFVAGRHRLISRRDLWLIVLGTNSPWVIFPLLGLYVSVRLAVEGNYSALGL